MGPTEREKGLRRLLRGIAEVGSIEFQRKWCVQGTRENYVLLDELIDTTIYRAKHKATHPQLSARLAPRDCQALLKFHDRVDSLFDQILWHSTSISIEEIVERNEPMQQIRQAANDCLQEFGVSFSTPELLQD